MLNKQDCLEAISTLGTSGFLEKYRSELTQELKSAKRKLVWIHGAGCSGCTMSFLNCDHELLGIIFSSECIIYHKTLLEQSGFFLEGIPVRAPEINIEYYLEDIEKTGGYVLVVEGALVEGPDNSGKYCLIGGETVKERIVKAANKAKVIITLGTCASCGGIPGDRRSESVVRDFPGLLFRGVADRTIILNEHGITKPVVDLPGCPPNAVNITATVVHFLTFGELPATDQQGRPLFAYGQRIHDTCERRAQFDAGQFVEEWGDEGHRKGWCLYKMGCKGPATFHNCPVVRWNDGTSWPVGAGHGCVGCSERDFWDTMTPFYRRLPQVPGFGIQTTVDTIGPWIVGGTAAAFAAHGVVSAIRAKTRPPQKSEEEK